MRSYDENFAVARNCDAELALRAIATQLVKNRRHGKKQHTLKYFSMHHFSYANLERLNE
jgi:hypothetical protein